MAITSFACGIPKKEAGLAKTYWSDTITHETAGVTYYFSGPVEYGHYWNGDIFVVSNGGDITITQMTPEWSGAGRVMHGAMLQPTGVIGNGFDSEATWGDALYQASANVDPAATGSNLVIDAATYSSGASLVKAVSVENLSANPSRTVIDKYSVLTVVPSTPPKDAFRPPIVGTEKTPTYTLDDLDFSKLKSVEPVPGQAPIGQFSYLKEATFVSWFSGSETVRYLHPESYRHDYNDYYLDGVIVPVLMALHSNYTESEKRDLYAAIVQQGIDYAAYQVTRNEWLSHSTHVELFPPIIATAASALNSKEIAAALLVPYTNENFFYVTPDLVGVEKFSWTSSHTPSFGAYQDVQVGLPEFRVTPEGAVPSLYAAYRSIVSDNVPITALLMDMLGSGEVRNLIKYPAYFDYAERMRPAFNADPSVTGPGHGQEPAWTAFLAAYHSIYNNHQGMVFRPESPRWQDVSVVADNGNLDVSFTGPVLTGGSPLNRVDVRYKEAGGEWNVIENFGMSGQISGLPAGVYFVQGRYVNDVGEGPWSVNEFSLNNVALADILFNDGIVTQAEVDALGGLLYYRASPLYEEHLRSVWSGDAGFADLTNDLVSATAIIL